MTQKEPTSETTDHWIEKEGGTLSSQQGIEGQNQEEKTQRKTIVETSIKKGQQTEEIIPRAAGNKNHANRWSYQGIPLMGKMGHQKTKNDERNGTFCLPFRNLPKGHNKARKQLKRKIATGTPTKKKEDKEYAAKR